VTATIVEEIARPPDYVVEALRGASAADVHEAMGKTGAVAPAIGPVTEATSLCGPAVTVTLPPGDNMMIHAGAKLAQPGDVLVIAADTTRAATWGELATRNALRNDLAGVVSDGNVRDVERIAELGFPVFGRAVSHSGARKDAPGSVNVPVSVGDTLVCPGDVIVGDADGVTVVPQGQAETVVEALAAKTTREAEIRDRIEDGEELFDIILGEEALDQADVDTVSGPVDYADTPRR